MSLVMIDPKQLRHLSEAVFWKLSINEKSAYLRAAINVARSYLPKERRPKKQDPKKRRT